MSSQERIIDLKPLKEQTILVLVLAMVLTCFFVFAPNAHTADETCHAVTPGDWNDGTIWTGCGSGPASVPALTDNPIIDEGVLVTLTQGITVGDLTINGNLEIPGDAKSFTVAANSITIGPSGSFNANRIIITTGAWHMSGIFLAGESTVVFDHTASITGSTDFYNLSFINDSESPLVVTVQSGMTIGISSELTITGQPGGGSIQFRSDSEGSQWFIHPTGTAVVDYADVEDGGCADGSVTMITSNSVDSGRTDACWGLTPANSAPADPTTLGPASKVNGSSDDDSQPALSFVIPPEPDGDQVQYEIQVSTDNTFLGAPLVLDYLSGMTNALDPVGCPLEAPCDGSREVSYSVGQNPAEDTVFHDGSYTIGESGQSLEAGDYYWRVRVIDDLASSSNWVTANDGNVAFVVAAPTSRISMTVPSFGGTVLVSIPPASNAQVETDSVHPHVPLWEHVVPLSGSSNNTQSLGSTNAIFSNMNLTVGSISSQVYVLQHFLNVNGFTIASSGPGSPGREVNHFGPLTRQALIRFQEAHAKEILYPFYTHGTGIFGPRTREYINTH